MLEATRYGEIVSIQLVSPARGESGVVTVRLPYSTYSVSIQLVSPARGENLLTQLLLRHLVVSIQLVSPARGEARAVAPTAMAQMSKQGFHSIGFPCERGVVLTRLH